MARGALIQYRRGTAEQWATANPVLADGEVGFDRTNGEIRVGTGFASWTDLPAIGGASAEAIGEAVTAYLDAHPIPGATDAEIASFVIDPLSETHAAVLALVPQGPAGDSAYQVAVDNGFVGSEAAWLISLRGSDGEAGATTIAGIDGLRQELDDRALTADVVGFVDSVGTAITSLSSEVGTKATQESVNALSDAQVTLAGNLDSTHGLATEAKADAAAAREVATAAQATASAAYDPSDLITAVGQVGITRVAVINKNGVAPVGVRAMDLVFERDA